MAPRPFRLGRARTGLGIFATRPIKKRQTIAEYKGKMLGVEAAVKAEKSGNRYLYEVNSKWTIDGAKRGNIARYFNHSCNPNADTFIRGKRVFVRTIKNIEAGDEITYDYGRDYLKNVIGLENCQCSRCRKRRAKERAEARERSLRKKKRLAAATAKGKGKGVKKAAVRKSKKTVKSRKTKR
ncbi:SET domain-containing protein [Undibacter mobilis]|uniref:SET domain-containing protein n=1 Tax=Undibacter mobilis TaxID=2292256 RepID=A0A371BC85_9BRAD|nr:SET domain-containing protein [Undibacter mobilis]RDV05215.1 SET domain-containing protein [Undibacter mobilis]